MTQYNLNDQTILAIKTLWQNKIPPKIIAEVLEVKYPLISLYCRSFKSLSKQNTSADIVAKILNPAIYYLGTKSPEEIISDYLLASEDR